MIGNVGRGMRGIGEGRWGRVWIYSLVNMVGGKEDTLLEVAALRAIIMKYVQQEAGHSTSIAAPVLFHQRGNTNAQLCEAAK